MYLTKINLVVIATLYWIGSYAQLGTNMGNYPTGGTLGTAATTVDLYALMNIQQTTPGQVITIPTPSNVLAAKNMTITNTGTTPVELIPGGIVIPGSGVIYRWTGSWIVTGAGMASLPESANKAYAGPPSGSPSVPVFRNLVSDDIPNISATKVTGLGTVATSNSYNDLSFKPTIPTNTNQLTNGAGYITGINSSMVTSALGYTPYNSTNPNGYVANLSTFTTTNLDEGTNQYYTNTRARAALSQGTGITYNSSTGLITNSSPDQTVSLSNGTGISATGTYPSFTITNTAPDQTVVLTAGRGISITGTYPNFTISLVTPTITIRQGGTARAVNSNFTISATKEAIATYTVTCSVTNPLLAGTSTATAFLEYSTDAGSTWLLPSQVGNSSNVGITVTIQLTNGQTGTLVGVIPANALVRIRTTTAGTASVAYVTGQETVY